MNKFVCRYAIVQFMPYPETEEFANVGVIIEASQKNLFGFKLEQKQTKRITGFFNDLDRNIYLSAIKSLGEELGYLEESVKNHHMTSTQAFEVIVRPLETMLRFSQIRVRMDSSPENMTEALFDRFVRHDFAKSKNYDRKVQERVQKMVKDLKLRRPFRRNKLGTKIFEVTMPMVQELPNRHFRVIQPLSFSNREPSKIIDCANTWAGRFETLGALDKMPEEVLIPIEQPNQNDSERLEAWSLAKSRLANYGDIIDAGNKNLIADFAKKNDNDD